jgi:cell division protein FtsL
MVLAEASNKPRIRQKVLIPLVIVGAVAIVLFSIIGKSVLNTNIDHKIDHELNEVDELLGRLLRSDSRAMESQLRLISEEPELHKAWASRDRERLLARSKPILNTLEDAFQVSHFYFVEPDRKCFLRVHAPERKGDVISRYTMLEAEKNQQASSGIELGPLGTFTLRVVVPWMEDGKLIGYLEVGEEIGHLTPQLRWESELDVIFTIDKSKVDREGWEAGSRIFGRTGDWDDFRNFVVMDKTYAAIPKPISDYLGRLNGQGRVQEQLDFSGRNYRVATKELKDTSGTVVGKMIIIYDATAIFTSFQKGLSIAIAVAVGMACLLLGALYVYIGKIDTELRTYRTKLEELVDAKTAELQRAQEEVKKLAGFIPICSYCKKIRDDKGYWNMLELYISQRSDATFEHCICEECLKKNFPGIDEMRNVADELNTISTDDESSPETSTT